MPILEVSHLSCCFADGTRALDDISLTVDQGSFVIIAGANGCGKTTLMRHLNGLMMPQKGSVRVAGKTVTRNPSWARQKVGMVFQDADSQLIGETVYDDVAFGPENLRLQPEEIHQRVMDALAVVNMTAYAEQRPHLLSGGEKRRVAIAGILAMKSEVLVLDEPFSNLDYLGVRQVLQQITVLHQSGHTIFLATHDLEKVLAHGDRLIVMAEGRILRDGPPQETVKGVERYGIREPYASKLGNPLTSWLS